MGLGVESHCCPVSFVSHYKNAMKELVDLECQKLLHFGLVWQFACALQSLDCEMRLEIQQLDTGMAALLGMPCCVCN